MNYDKIKRDIRKKIFSYNDSSLKKAHRIIDKIKYRQDNRIINVEVVTTYFTNKVYNNL